MLRHGGKQWAWMNERVRQAASKRRRSFVLLPLWPSLAADPFHPSLPSRLPRVVTFLFSSPFAWLG